MARVLVTDDHPLIHQILCEMFEREEGYDLCAEATNGQQAISLALKHQPDLIILDLSMPIMNRIEASKKLQKLMPDVPIILFTQHWDLTQSHLGNDGPSIDRVVSKSNAHELMGHVRSLASV
jgi:DNA-binding NarL/FixJ family response regulator